MTTLWDGSLILRADAPESVLSAAVEHNIAARSRYFAADPEYTLIENGSCLRVIGPRTYRVLLAHFPPERVETGIQAIIQEARRRPRYVTWVVGPVAGASAPDIVACLKQQGFMVDMQEPGMCAVLKDVIAAPPKQVPGLRIERVHAADVEQIDLFNRTAEASFKRPIALGRQVRRLVQAIGPDNPHLNHMQFYLGYLKNQPVASASTMTGGGVTGLYTVGTHPEQRGRGLGTQMTYHALKAAYDAGLRIGVLHASAQGYGIYARMGFRVIGQLTWLSTMWHALINRLFGPG